MKYRNCYKICKLNHYCKNCLEQKKCVACSVLSINQVSLYLKWCTAAPQWHLNTHNNYLVPFEVPLLQVYVVVHLPGMTARAV